MKNFILFVSVTVAAMYIGLGEALPLVCNSRMVEVQNKIAPGQTLIYHCSYPSMRRGVVKFNEKQQYEARAGKARSWICVMFKQGPQTDRYSVLFRIDFSKPPCNKGLLSSIAKNDGVYFEDDGKPSKFNVKWGKHP
ncbi:unnamed protein product [Brassica rapa]|uniref:S-protein homolog n=2 Tax=Brassica TaxID=3705 RepID=A0A8D9M3A5_BRACM|nr:unnamed protein product [Brassica napus]CAG7895615.1 unnamed protein product [Brassica rapa]